MEKIVKGLKRRWLYHVYAWTGYTALMYLVNRLNEDPPPFISIIAVTVLFILVFYLVLFMLRRFFGRGRYLTGALVLLGVFVVVALVSYRYIHVILPGIGITIAREDVLFTHAAFLKNVVIGITRFSVYALVYFLIDRKLRTDRERNVAIRAQLLAEHEKTRLEHEKLRLEHEKLQHEQAALGLQLNPHVLFNVINGLYARALEADGVLAEKLLLLSSLMEYAARVPQLRTGVLSLKKEWEMADTFRQLLTGDPVEGGAVRLEMKGVMNDQQVVPFVCITLLENGWKHGGQVNIHQPIILRVTVIRNGIRVQCSNTIGRRSSRGTSLHTGLGNLRRRLQIAFGENAYLTTCEREGKFYAHVGILYESRRDRINQQTETHETNKMLCHR